MNIDSVTQMEPYSALNLYFVRVSYLLTNSDFANTRHNMKYNVFFHGHILVSCSNMNHILCGLTKH